MLLRGPLVPPAAGRPQAQALLQRAQQLLLRLAAAVAVPAQAAHQPLQPKYPMQ